MIQRGCLCGGVLSVGTSGTKSRYLVCLGGRGAGASWAGAGVLAGGAVMHQGPSVQCVMQWGCYCGGGLVADLKKKI